MDNKAMSDLINRIKTEPSVLFLGQGYLRSLSGQDCFYDAVNRKLCGGNAPIAPSYQNLWEYVNAGHPLKPEQFDQMYKIVCDLPTQNWLRSILSMRWGMVFTSAVDSCLTHCVGPNFTFNALGYDKSRFRREYMSKSSLHGAYLYGSVDRSNGDIPPISCDSKTMRSLKKRVSDRIGWIYNEILRECGILVIDGWDPGRDWLSFLLDNASDMYYHSIYLFGVTPEMLGNNTIQGLLEDEILISYPQTFAQALEEYGYFQSDDTFLDMDYTSYDGGKTVTVRSKSGHDISLSIPLSALDVLDTRITLLDDELGYENQRRNTENLSEAFARYLQQNSTPIWSLCTIQTGFHFARRIDDKLWKEAGRLLRQKASYSRRLLILEGVSNSGKTASLVHFAMQIREQHRCPVFYISGNPSQTLFAEKLKSFIKRYLQGRQDSDGVWVEQVIILWDGNLSADAVRQYIKLSQELAECNALVIGTIYRHDSNGANIVSHPSKGGVTYIPVQATLTGEEQNELSQLLHRIDPLLNDRFQAAVRRVVEPNLLYLLQHIAKYQYSPEWKAVYWVLKERFDTEVDRSESNAQCAMEDFNRKPTEEEVHAEIIKHGVGAAWQLALARKLEEMRQNGEYEKGDFYPKDLAEAPEENKSKVLLEDIHLLNEMLAMAGQFSVPMPVTLLLNMIHHSGNLLSKENMFLNKLLANDSLIEYSRSEEGYPFVRFRHPKEAELYVEKNFGGEPDKRRECEVDLLCRLIAACHWNEDEAYNVIALVRCFGPNSEGKYSQNISQGNYTDYIQFLPKIANCLMEYADDNPEAVLVYAHFLRETYSNNRQYGYTNSIEYLSAARNKLRIAIERHDQQNRQQYNRLVVEVCSNLVASMPRHSDDGPFDRDVFLEFQNTFKQAISTWDYHNATAFGTNSLLDIWLNAVINFQRSFPSHEEAMKDHEFLKAIASSLDYIDRLFEINADFSSTNLLDKVETIYQWNPTRSMDTIVKKLEIKGNDTFLYLNAWRCWLSKSGTPVYKSAGEAEIVRRNLFLLPDDADAHAELIKDLENLKKEAVGAARKAVSYLESNMEQLRRSRSSRCLHMLIRAKWLLYTGYMPLEEKQKPVLTAEQWKEIYDLCCYYNSYCGRDDFRVQNLESFFRAVYLWSFTSDVGQARTIFSQLRQQMGNSWYVERIGLCVPGQKTLRTFYVDVERAASGSYTARISREITSENNNGAMDLRGRYGIHISDRILSELFDGQMPHNQYDIRKPVTLWFTANGPSLGFGREEGMSK